MKSLEIFNNAKTKEDGTLNVPKNALEKYSAFYFDLERYQRYLIGDFFGNLHISLPLSKGYDEHPFWLIAKLEYFKRIISQFFKDKKGA